VTEGIGHNIIFEKHKRTQGLKYKENLEVYLKVHNIKTGTKILTQVVFVCRLLQQAWSPIGLFLVKVLTR
jgi:hypothetical protein